MPLGKGGPYCALRPRASRQPPTIVQYRALLPGHHDCEGGATAAVNSAGLIDSHTHVAIYNIPNTVLTTADPDYQQIRQAASARYVPLDGLTSVRDSGGPVFGLKRAMDEVVNTERRKAGQKLSDAHVYRATSIPVIRAQTPVALALRAGGLRLRSGA